MVLPKVGDGVKLLCDTTVAGLQLLAGETMFGPRKSALGERLPTASAKKAALGLPMLCGLHHNIARSDLEGFL